MAIKHNDEFEKSSDSVDEHYGGESVIITKRTPSLKPMGQFLGGLKEAIMVKDPIKLIKIVEY